MSDLISRQAAIDVAKEELDNGTFYDIPSKIEYLPSAQPDLQPTCNQLATDCISRQAAIDKLKNNMAYMQAFGCDRAIMLIRELPSAQPERNEELLTAISREAYEQGYNDGTVDAKTRFPVNSERKKGKWINRSLNILYPEWERYTCSVCGKHSYNYDFCPNCGSYNGGEQNVDE